MVDALQCLARRGLIRVSAKVYLIIARNGRIAQRHLMRIASLSHFGRGTVAPGRCTPARGFHWDVSVDY